MEVHHSHHRSNHRKKIKEYIIEFLMLFLAVSLGFLAENIREHYVEKERAHELLQSFMQDVQTNIKMIDSLVEGNRRLNMKNDSAVLYIMQHDEISLDSFFNLLPLQSQRYLYNNETYEQMKSSGSLRYIKDSVLLKYMIDYSNLSKSAEFRSVSQEAEYVGHEYTSVMQKWVTPYISIKRQSGFYLRRPEYNELLKSENDKLLQNQLDEIASQGKSTMKGIGLEEMRKDLVPAITRKVLLVAGSSVFMMKTRNQAKKLITYYDAHKK
ncbi:MAG: hypothetical protein EBX50_06220 [Chitinophagia bacterium]|nr:hypothetical protein [Chitinophagia bacterium]